MGGAPLTGGVTLTGGVGGWTAAVCVAWIASSALRRAGATVGAGVGEAGGRNVAAGVGKDGAVAMAAVTVASTCPTTGSTSFDCPQPLRQTRFHNPRKGAGM